MERKNIWSLLRISGSGVLGGACGWPALIPQLPWNLCLFPCLYSVILGGDWLEENNPIIDWKSKIIHFEPKVCVVEYVEALPEYLQEFADVFDKGKSEILPEHRNCDLSIELMDPEFSHHARVYPKSPKELELEKAEIKENLRKGFIRVSNSKISSPTLYQKKKDGDLK